MVKNAYPVPISVVVPIDPQRKQPGQHNRYLTTLYLRLSSVSIHGDYMFSMIYSALVAAAQPYLSVQNMAVANEHPVLYPLFCLSD